MNQRHTVILVGAGRAHLYVAAHADVLVERGARVVLVDLTDIWYSGLATGLPGGYEPAADQVDPRALIESHGGEFIQDRVEAVNIGVPRMRLAGGGHQRNREFPGLCQAQAILRYSSKSDGPAPEGDGMPFQLSTRGSWRSRRRKEGTHAIGNDRPRQNGGQYGAAVDAGGPSVRGVRCASGERAAAGS